MKNILKILIPAVALSLGGCGENYSNYTKCKEKDNMVLKTWKNGMGNFFRIDEKDYEGKTISYLVARDDFPLSKDNIGDGKIDKITTLKIKEGSALEKYSIELINELFQEVRETGNDCKK